MKKVSTAARCEFGKFVGQRLTIGLDLGGRWSWYCVLDEQVACKARLGRKFSRWNKS